MLRPRYSAPLIRSSSFTGRFLHGTAQTSRCYYTSSLECGTRRSKTQLPGTSSTTGWPRKFTSAGDTQTDALRQLALSHHLHPERLDTSHALPESLRAHIYVSLLPVNQQCALAPASRAQPGPPPLPLRPTRPPPHTTDEEPQIEKSVTLEEINGLGEPVIGVVSPIEGGDCYNRKAVLQVAQDLGAEVVRIDLALVLGLTGPSGPLGVKGAPSIPDKINPLLDRSQASRSEMDKSSQDGGEEMDFPDDMGPEGHFKIPVMTLGAFPSQAHTTTPHSINDDWVAFFSTLINENDSDRPRILLLESCSTMSSTFHIWWPSLAEAVRSRRRKARSSPGRRNGSKATVWDLVKPTSVVLSFAPSLLGSHTACKASAASSGLGEEIWWGSEENDVAGRQQRDKSRIEALRTSKLDARQLIPTASPPADSNHSNPILAALASKFSSQSSEDGAEPSLLWQAIPMVPSIRQPELEAETRRTWRRAVSVGLVARALGQLQSTLTHTPELFEALEWTNRSLAWPEAQCLAVLALGRGGVDNLTISLADIEAAQAIRTSEFKRTFDHLEDLLPKSEILTRQSDPVINALKRATDLNKYEKRLLPCVVDAHKLASTNFSRVHLPDSTIDAIRTMVSLPLLHPEAFRTGILGEHSAGGALLFGPPGTGKTLLARAVASESGARMLAIQPSDVNDMYVGEGEKLVRAVFSLARRLSPCVVFIDEVDSLFGARSAKDSSGSGRSHNQLLTEFMQEMDGLNSAVINREQRIVVVGATNRPFDLDEAVLRRLPRRLLIDLPRQEDRKAILSILLHEERLAADVDLEKLASLTDGFSGSDLKHLCVAAALAALKDTVKLPWLFFDKRSRQYGVTPTPLPPLPGTTRSQPIETPSVNEPAQKHVLEARIQRVPNGVRHVHSSLSRPGFDQIAQLHTTVPPPIPAISRESGTSATGDSRPTSTRVLHWKHFETALSEISPSSSEDGTLPELQKWAEQFGDGGSRRAPRKGFGKGFGFSILTKTPGAGYGRVKTDET